MGPDWVSVACSYIFCFSFLFVSLLSGRPKRIVGARLGVGQLLQSRPIHASPTVTTLDLDLVSLLAH